MRLFALLVVIAAVPAIALAQFDSGQISGFVRDVQQAAVPGATVTVTNERNADHRTTVTNSTGFYVFPELPVGAYTVTVELSGFKKFAQTGLRLSAADQIAVDATLQVGSLEETVEVTASASHVQTTTAQVARTIDTRQIQALTLNGRNPIFLASLKPGVRGGTIGTFDPDSVTNGSFSINGARDDEYVVMVDGAIATRTRSPGSMLGAQDVETVEEVNSHSGSLHGLGGVVQPGGVCATGGGDLRRAAAEFAAPSVEPRCRAAQGYADRWPAPHRIPR